VILRSVAGGGRHGGSDSLNLDSFHVNGGRGVNGSGNGKTGRNGKTAYLDVPVGTVAREIIYDDEDSGDDGEFVTFYDFDNEGQGAAGGGGDKDNKARSGPRTFTYGRTFDLSEPGVEFLVAQGGRGGLGNIARDPRKISYRNIQLRIAEEERVAAEEAAKAKAKRRRRAEEGADYETDSESEDEEEEEEVGADDVDDGYDGMYDFLDEPDDAMRHVSGDPGEMIAYELELKSIADIGLVGYPNAGKSTLLSCVSRARPAVAPYPFTTLHPFVGIVEFRDGKRISVADIPGLVDGAAEHNAGLGHSFLRHIERTRALAYVVDVGSGMGGDLPLEEAGGGAEEEEQEEQEDGEKEAPADAADDHSLHVTDIATLEQCVERAAVQLTNLRAELDMYAPGMSARPAVVVANKLDTIDLEAVRQSLAERREEEGAEEEQTLDIMAMLAPLGACVSNDPNRPATVIPLSARAAVGVRPLVRELRGLMEWHAE
jgi:GTP-binding protein